jgi:hypothetical protein
MNLIELICLAETTYKELMIATNNQCLIIEYNDRAKQVNNTIGWQGLKIIQ